MNAKNEFLTKLGNLLTEYHAEIGWTCGEDSDTHGIYDERIWIASDGWRVDINDAAIEGASVLAEVTSD